MSDTTAVPNQGQAKPNIDYSQFGNYSDSAKQAVNNGANLQDVQNAFKQFQKQQPQQTPAQQPQGKTPSWWERLLPTVGSVIGGVGGALIPGLGETGVGEIAGYSGGQAVGQGLENLLTGKPWSQDVAKAGIEGAVMGGAGKVLGLGTSALGGALKGYGTRAEEKVAADALAAKTAHEADQAKIQADYLANETQRKADIENYNAPLKQKYLAEETANKARFDAEQKAKAVNTQAETTKAYYGSIHPKVQENLGLSDSLDKAAQLNLDPNNPKNLSDIGKANYGYNRVMEEAIGKAPNIQGKLDLTGATNKWLNESGSQLNDLSGVLNKSTGQYEKTLNSEGQQLFNDLTNSYTDAGINLSSGTISRMQLKQATKNIGDLMSANNSKITAAAAAGQKDAVAEARSDVLNKAYKNLSEEIYNHSSIDKYVKNKTLTLEEENAIRLENKDNPAVAQYTIDSINKSTNAKNLLTEMQTSTNAGKLGTMADKNVTQAKATPGAVKRTSLETQLPDIYKPLPEPKYKEYVPGTAPESTPYQEPIQPTTGQKVTQGVVDVATTPGKLGKALQAGQSLHGLGLLSGTAKRTGSLLERIGKVTIPKAKPFKSGALPSVSPLGMAAAGTGALLTTPPPVAGQQQGGAMQGAQTAQPAQPNANLEAFNQLMNQAQGTLGTSSSPALIQALSALAPIVSKQQEAAPLIQSLQQSYQNAGGAQGPLQGLITKFSGLLPGSAASAYQQQQESTSSALSNILGLNPAQSQQLRGLMPSLMSNQQTAQPQITALQNLTGQFGGPTIGQ